MNLEKLRCRPLKTKLHVPIYDAKVWLVVSDDIEASRKAMERLFGPAPDIHGYDALCSWSGGGTFGLFFLRKSMSLNTVSHEVFHLTHRIMEWVSANFDPDHHEQGAMLHGHLMSEVMKKIRKWR